MSTMLNLHAAISFRDGPTIDCRLSAFHQGAAITIFFGPSGAGKSCLLRFLAGLLKPDKGLITFGQNVWFDSEKRIWLPPQKRSIGFLTQDFCLFPHLSVSANIAYGLRHLSKAERDFRTSSMMDRLEIRELARRLPRELSGGQQQRVALARAVVRQPKLLLLDEPLSALDAATRAQLRHELRVHLMRLGIPTIIVTHDRLEALALGDEIVVIDAGGVLQLGRLLDVFQRPASSRVAAIVGVDTVLPAKLLSCVDGIAILKVGEVQVQAVASAAITEDCFACIRGEDVILESNTGQATSARNRWPGKVTAIIPEGPLQRVRIDCGFSIDALITRAAVAELGLEPGKTVLVLVKAPSVHVVSR